MEDGAAQEGPLNLRLPGCHPGVVMVTLDAEHIAVAGVKQGDECKVISADLVSIRCLMIMFLVLVTRTSAAIQVIEQVLLYFHFPTVVKCFAAGLVVFDTKFGIQKHWQPFKEKPQCKPKVRLLVLISMFNICTTSKQIMWCFLFVMILPHFQHMKVKLQQFVDLLTLFLKT